MRAMFVIAAIVSAIFMLFFYGVGEEQPEALPMASPTIQHDESLANICSGPVLETMNSGGYTYVRVDCGDRELWAAGPETQVAKGDRVSIPPGQPMENFHSQTLDRTFETIFFVPSIQFGGGTGAQSVAEVHQQSAGAAEQAEVDLSGIDRPAEAKSVAEIFASRDQLKGTEVLVLGRVVKYNAMIMGKNWLHVQDGTGAPGSNDLTVTTQGTASVGDTVLVRGIVGLNKDLGAGYRYDVLIEDAVITFP